MRQLGILLIFVLLFLSGCTNTESNSPALQANVEGNLFKALDARAFINKDSSLTIQGNNEIENLSIILKSNPDILNANTEGVYTITDSTNQAKFTNAGGELFSSEFGGRGQVIISTYDEVNKFVSGTFNFSSISPGVDTLTVNRGIFFEVPVLVILEPEQPALNGTIVAKINDEIFNNPTILRGTDANNLITVTAIQREETIKLSFPNDIVSGDYFIQTSGFSASYTIDGNQENGISGKLIIRSHDKANKLIKANFSFNTQNSEISSGTLSLTYR
jgi:hypothetical protein